MPTIREVMTRDVKVLSPTDSVQAAAQQMRSLDIGALPVCDGPQLVGMITDRDITVRAVAAGHDPQRTRVGEVLSPDAIWCFDDAAVEEVARLMREQQVRRLPVVDHRRQLVGIVSLGDLAVDGADASTSGETLEGISQPRRA